MTQLIVPDNARAMIADPNRYEPRANDTVLDFARHYGYLAHPKMCLVDSSRLHFASRP